MVKLEQRLRRLEKEVPACGHSPGIGITLCHTEEKAERLKREMAECPNCLRFFGNGSGPVIMWDRYRRDE